VVLSGGDLKVTASSTEDIITAAEGKEISCYADLIPVFYELEPGQSAGFEIRRKSGNGYQTMTLTVTF